MPDPTDPRYHVAKPSFAEWLLTQASRDDATGAIAKAAKADNRFPRKGDLEAVSRRLNEMQADGDTHAALEDAELDYLSI